MITTPIKHLKKTCMLLVFSILFHVLTPAALLADTGPVLTNIKLANTRDDLLIYFKVKNAFPQKITQAIENGIPTTFSYYVSLYRTSDLWLDKKIADIDIKSTVKFNSLKQEYAVSRAWKDDTPSVTKSLEAAEDWMTEIDNLTVIPLADLVKGQKYQIKIKANLARVTLPFSLHYVFFFVSLWDIETDWYVINFTY